MKNLIIKLILALFFYTSIHASEYCSIIQTNEKISKSNDQIIFSYKSNQKFRSLICHRDQNLKLAFDDYKIIGTYKNKNYPYKKPKLNFRTTESNQKFHNLINTTIAHQDIEKKYLNKKIPEIVVAVADVGFDINHKSLKNRIYQNKLEIPDNGIDDDQNGKIDDVSGWNFCDQNGKVYPKEDWDHHGTHVAGLIGANTSFLDAKGVAYNVKILPLLWYQDYCRWSSSLVAKTFSYAIEQGALIINSSFDIDEKVNDPIFIEAINYVSSKGAVVFNSAGNDKKENVKRLTNNSIVFIGSVTEDLNKSKFSNFGTGVNLSAPGEHILSTGLNDRYVHYSGTSMSTPIAIGVLINYLLMNPNLDLKIALSQLYRTSKVLTPMIKRGKNLNFGLGTGMVNYTSKNDCKNAPFKLLGINDLEFVKNDNFKSKPISKISLKLNSLIKSELNEIKNALQIFNSKKEKITPANILYSYNLGDNNLEIFFSNELEKDEYEISFTKGKLLDQSGCEILSNLIHLQIYKGWW